ncbi:MAG: NfeD family protein [Bauldia sp.]|nr:MAG: NfeD family protein [Bauldia sp.]MBZ0227272.1 NfeD family protein [Bauldia sp.]
MILQYLESLGPWGWWIAGLVLLGLEIVVPGNVFVWFGIAGLLVGALALFTDLGWQIELIVFGVLSLILVVAGRRYFARPAAAGEEPLLNERATRLVGKVFVLGEPIVDGRGTIRVGDANWLVAGPDLPSGSHVRVTGHDGSVLTVKRAETPPS